jgi:hypothetical protein
LAQAKKGELDAFLNKLNDRLSRYIEQRDEKWTIPEDDPGPFRIMYS